MVPVGDNRGEDSGGILGDMELGVVGIGVVGVGGIEYVDAGG